ncbi:hypothetical protein V565_084940 [Rhizoctonia solani 123E]|uniref:Uncharacterized protein n=1 Tax=Rhizoctonia solani 123E TaxID=1423351 RepID=A0A074RTI9_9AGAM|nr:hypothetical protein V565_084940 [Rhizoctonia solani 123E]
MSIEFYLSIHTTMNSLRLALSRSTFMLSERVLAPSPLQLVRLKSTTAKPIRLFSPAPRRLEVAVTPRKVTLTFAESPATPLAPKATKTATTLQDVKAGIDAKVRKVLNLMEANAATKAAGSATVVKATKIPKTTSKPNKEKLITPDATVKSTDAVPCWVDASPTHIAIVIGGQYKVFALNDGWMTKARDINWAETAAFELLAQILANQGRSGIVQVNSDSAAALRAMSGERVRVPEIMDSARRTSDILKTSMFTIKGVKVSRTTNLADRFTRGKTMNGYEEMGGDIVVPEALVPYVTAL